MRDSSTGMNCGTSAGPHQNDRGHQDADRVNAGDRERQGLNAAGSQEIHLDGCREHDEQRTEKKLKPDYAFYITNQIAKPISQVFGLVLDRLPGVKSHQIAATAKARDPTAAREALAEELLFGDLLQKARGQTDLRSFFSVA